MNCLRLRLPPLASFSAESFVDFAFVDTAGQVRRQGRIVVHALPTLLETRALRIEARLHPVDASLAVLTVPPLSGARLSRAIAGALDLLSGDEIERLTLAHSLPNAQQQVTVAWVDAGRLRQALACLDAQGCRLQALYPAALTLAYPLADQPAGWRVYFEPDNAQQAWIIARSSAREGFCCPVLPDAVDVPLEWQLAAQRQAVDTLHWYGALPLWAERLTPVRVSDTAPWWAFAPPVLNFVGARNAPSLTAPLPWRPLAYAALMLYGIIGIGMTVHAYRLGYQTQALKNAMRVSLQQAFPEMTLIIDPVRQLQQRLARLEAGPARSTTPGQIIEQVRGFNAFINRLSGQLSLPPGAIQGLNFSGNTLTLRVDRQTDSAQVARQAAAAGLSFRLNDHNLVNANSRDIEWIFQDSGEGKP